MVSENKSRIIQKSFPQLKNHPQWRAAEFILKTLQTNGFEALIAGGAVRDLLMRRTPGDVDIATSATPDQVENLFKQTVAVGKAFGVVRVIESGESIEVATYRMDLEYKDGRRPEGVLFSNRVEDAKRRDFTMNALFYDPFTETVFDDVGGIQDIQNRILKCVGLAGERFQEDELRRLRLVRFVSQLGFQIEPQTLKALVTGIEGLQKVSRERITEEVGKMWLGEFLLIALPVWFESGMATQIDPAWGQLSTASTSLKTWGPRDSKIHAWIQYFSFFFDEPSIKSHIKRFKFSRDLEKIIETAFGAYREGESFFKVSLGEQWMKFVVPGFSLGLEYYLEKKIPSAERPKFRQILENLKHRGDLPSALVKAQHLQNLYQGAELGNKLKSLYLEQLNQGWTSTEEALSWLSRNS
jgi:tRNA nucleotidyltransferase/poly(A) polymerase